MESTKSTSSLTSSFADVLYDTFAYSLKDPIIILITLVAVVGSVCLLSGLMLLCMVSKLLNDQTSEAILLTGIGFFITAVACVAWKLTSQRRFSAIIDAVKQQTV